MGLTPPSRVEKPFTKPSAESASHVKTRTPFLSRQEKPAVSGDLVSVIVSIGIDIIEVRRVRETLERTQRFIDRVYTEKERQYCESRGAAAAQHFAARFAAKEAMLKALQTGWSGGIAWQDVEVCSRDSGAPYLKLSGVAQDLFDKSGANRIHLSISHTAEHAIAQVILEKA
jgi:holo-[acyl-carrier protein] synthase